MHSEEIALDPGARRPMSVTEAKVAELWREVLQLPEIDARANFVELGGDSVAAMHCLNLIRRDFGRQIPLATFLSPQMTLGKLAALIDDVSDASRATLA
jgi:acyl carrier protein